MCSLIDVLRVVAGGAVVRSWLMTNLQRSESGTENGSVNDVADVSIKCRA